jgi:hypothetical protein
MTKSTKKIAKDSQDNTTNANNINRGNPIYYDNILHYIVYEFEDKMIVSKNEDLTKAYCVRKSRVSVKPTK